MFVSREGIERELSSAYDYLDTLIDELSHNAYCAYPARQTCKEKSHKFTAAEYTQFILDQRIYVGTLEAEYNTWSTSRD